MKLKQDDEKIILERLVAKRTDDFVYDPKGFFVIYLDNRGKNIMVEYYENVYKKDGNDVVTGKLRKIIVGKNAEAIGDTIISNNLISRLDHAFYIGRELQKAEWALKNDLKYIQEGKGGHKRQYSI